MKMLWKVMKATAGLGAVVAAGCLVAGYRAHRTQVLLPTPTGPYPVSRTTEVWIDATRPDPLVGGPPSRTELFVWIWYPAARATGLAPASYVPPDWQREMDRHQSRLGGVLTTFLTGGAIQPHSVLEGAPAQEPSRLPVVILRGGLGALVIQYTTLAEDLASHGYLVLGFDAPYRTGIVVFPDGRVVTRPDSLNPETVAGEARRDLAARLMAAWVSDVGFAVDRLQQMNGSGPSRFRGRLDLGRVAVVGHSLGGATAAQFCHDDPRCRAGADLDGLLLGSVVKEGLDRPFLFLLSDHAGSTDPEDQRIAADVRAVYERLPPATRQLFSIRGSNHFSFADTWLARPQLAFVLSAAGKLRLEPRRGLAVAAETLRRFLDVHLRGAPPETLRDLPSACPELRAGLP